MDAADRTPARRTDPLLQLWTAAAVIAALLPLTRVVVPSWLLPAALVVLAVLLAGGLVRRSRHPGWAFLPEALVWMLCAVGTLPDGVPRAAVLPTGETIAALDQLLAGVVEEIRSGVAPLAPSAGLRWTIVAGAGLLAVAIAHVALTARLPLLAAAGLVAVSAPPSLIVASGADPVFFVLLALAILLMLRADARSRRRTAAAEPMGSAAAGSTAAAIVGVVVLATTVAVVPALPAPIPHQGTGLGGSTGITATLDLGATLRQPAETEVLRVSTDAPGAPYLRIATLSSFDGGVWAPDAGGLSPLDEGFAPADEITAADTEPATARIDITRLDSTYLPVPYPALSLTGVDGSWSVLAANRTVVGDRATSLGETYTVQWERLDPSREQANRARAGADWLPPQTTALPELPPVIPQLAADVTANATTPYEALSALQNWFRGGEFTYSLDAPVEEGFDGSGVDAIARFLEVREGYCVHFASAFAVMARTLGIPTRVVLGYLPGTPTGARDDGLAVYSVSSTQLHSWPEAYLDGLGWVPFEPTASLGTPTGFASETPGAAPDPAEELPRPGEEAPAAPTPTPSATSDDPTAGPLASGNDGETGQAAVWLLLAPVIIALLCAPAAVRLMRRRERTRPGADALSAWRELVDTAIDAGIDVHASESPRRLGTRLVDEAGAPPADVARLVGDVERAAFAPRADDAALGGRERAESLRRIRAALLPTAALRARALLLPRSLVIRPTLAEPAER